MTVQELVQEAWSNSEEKGFHEGPQNIPEKLALIHSEVSEALEAHREHGLKVWNREDGKPEGFLFELVDVMIRCADLIGIVSTPEALAWALEEKMEFNKTRPHKHGKTY